MRTYKLIKPESVFAPYAFKKMCDNGEPEYKMNKYGDCITNVEFLDAFVSLLRRHANKPAKFYAEKMKVDSILFYHTILTLTGVSAKDWVLFYVKMQICELICKTDMPAEKIYKKMGFANEDLFVLFCKKNFKETPFHFRYELRRKDVESGKPEMK